MYSGQSIHPYVCVYIYIYTKTISKVKKEHSYVVLLMNNNAYVIHLKHVYLKIE